MEDRAETQKMLFAAFVCISFNLEGAHFVLVPTIFAKLFGPQGGLRVFSIGFTFIATASFINLLVLNLCLDRIGFAGIQYLYCSFSVVSLSILLFTFKEQKVTITHPNHLKDLRSGLETSLLAK